MEGCTEQDILRTDREIIRLDRAIWARLPVNGELAFGKSEYSWLAYRRSYCEAQASSYGRGSAAPLVFATCVASLNEAHIRTLSLFYKQLLRH